MQKKYISLNLKKEECFYVKKMTKKEANFINKIYFYGIFFIFSLLGIYLISLNLFLTNEKIEPYLNKQNSKEILTLINNNFFSYFGMIVIGLSIICILIMFYWKKPYKKNKTYDNIKNINDVCKVLNHRTFEDFIAYLYRKKGCEAYRVGFGSNVKKTKEDGTYGDGGKDVIIKRPFRKDIIVQCKFYNENNYVGVSVIREMFATMIHYKASQIIIITTSYFTQDALKFAEGKKIKLIDRKELEKIIINLNH